jgi:quercetin dioxygenase-like cupin family protein
MLCYDQAMQKLPHINSHNGDPKLFTGSVTVLPLKPATETSRLSMSVVSFEAGARSAWHTHSHGQTLYVTDGFGMIQKRGEPIQTIKTGDVVWTEPGEEHWHRASADQGMTHLAIQEVDNNGDIADWHERVGDDEYDQQP